VSLSCPLRLQCPKLGLVTQRLCGEPACRRGSVQALAETSALCGHLSVRSTWKPLTCAPGGAIGGLLSVALSCVSPRLAVSQHPALWSPDLPQPRSPEAATTRPTHRRTVCPTSHRSPTQGAALLAGANSAVSASQPKIVTIDAAPMRVGMARCLALACGDSLGPQTTKELQAYGPTTRCRPRRGRRPLPPS